MIPPRPPRKTIGNVSYDRSEWGFDDPELGEKRRKLFAMRREKQVATMAKLHLRRIVNEDGIAMSIREFFDKKGRPPKDISLASIMRMYQVMEKQEGWLTQLSAQAHAHLKSLDVARYVKAKAALAGKLRQSQEDRRKVYFGEARKGGMVNVPTKVLELIKEAVKNDLAARQESNLSDKLSLEFADILGSRQIQIAMKHVFSEFLLPEDTTVPDDKIAQYDYLSTAVNEFDKLIVALRQSIYDLRELFESADHISQTKS